MLLQSLSLAAIDSQWGWQPIAEVVDRIFAITPRPFECDICGRAPCTNPGFCSLCRQANVKTRSKPSSSRIEAPKAAVSTVDALMFSLRSRGTAALTEPDTQRRLTDLSDDQLIEVGSRLQKLRPEIARAWTAEEVQILFQARIK